MTIENVDELGRTPAHETALACLEAGIEAAHPEQVVRDSVSLDGDTLTVQEASYDLSEYDRVLVVGGGKAGGGVTTALESVLGGRISGGVVVTRDPEETESVEIVVGSHPVPDEAGVEGAREILELLAGADERTLVLGVITGGASALLAAPAEGISLSDLQQTTTELLESGAEIDEINAVRKHLSAVKGGQLARAASPGTVVGLVLSDVVGNDLSVIASGPTAPDDSTFADALDVVARYDIDAPDAVRERLEAGAAGSSDVPETPRADDPLFERVTNHVLADGFTALDAARSVARLRGYNVCLLSSRIRGEAREAAKSHVAVGEEVRATGNPVETPAVILAGGETTVTVRGDGRGGPNQEFALAAALELRGTETVLAAVDTDGRDGGVDVAGALVDGETVDDVAAARSALASNDAFPYLDERAALVRTGPTGTNVNDLRVLVVSSSDSPE